MSKKYLLVASTGGHLTQLAKLAPRLGVDPNSVWLTFRSPQSISLLPGSRKVFVPYVAPRDFKGVIRTAGVVYRTLRGERFDSVVSTGAGIAIGAFLAAALCRVPRLYIESVSRTNGPSLTGRLTSILHLAALRTQHPTWANRRWTYHGSVLNEYSRVPATPRTKSCGRRILVTLGTIKPYRFDAAVDAVLRCVAPTDTIVWQLGATSRRNLPGKTFDLLDSERFIDEVRAADIVISHAGVGTIIQLLDQGIYPIILVRRSERNEHVDDHQSQIAQLLTTEDLAVTVEAPLMEEKHLIQAQQYQVAAREREDQEGNQWC
jgi:UDP-N-acetylglucosamine transferase subunit ALG13